MNSKITLAPVKGTKDYLPDEQVIREWITDNIKEIFKLYGYRPIETAILDYWEVGASKYAGGDEILNETYRLRDRGGRDLILRYELTFKLAKLIGMYPNLRMPFKRYEIGKVFRDGPVKTGRFREFTQCDVDVIGSDSMAVDAELMKMAFDVFKKLGLDVYIQINNKKLQFGLFMECGIDKHMLVPAALSLDKLVKFGKETVIEEMKDKGINEESINKLFNILEKVESLPNEDRIDKIGDYVKNNSLGMQGVNEVKDFLKFCKAYGIKEDVVFLPSLARGLGYYTGMVWEVYLKETDNVKSSLAAGGRWDDMIKNFLNSERNFPATGITFGLDVIYEAIKEKGLEHIKHVKNPQVYIIPIETLAKCLETASALRNERISCDVAFDKKLSKALDYANKEHIPYVLIIGIEEMEKNKVKLKDMDSGKEELMSVDTVIEYLTKKLKS